MTIHWLTIVLASALLVFNSGIQHSSLPKEEPAGINACSASACEAVSSRLKSVDEDSLGRAVETYDNGVVVTRISEDEWIITDYYNAFGSEIPEKSGQRSWVMIGKAILRFIAGVLSTCQAVQYLTGHDICRIVLSYISSSQNGTITYELTGNYIPGYIPGCEPMYSLPCNSGYWEYRVVRA